MAVRLVSSDPATPLERLVDDYLSSCRARGHSPRSDRQYSQALRAVFLPWCAREGITRVEELDRRALDHFTSMLLSRRKEDGQPLSKHSVHTYIRPVRLMLTWAAREGEQIQAKPQLPRREKPVRDVLSREEIDRMEKAVGTERDKLIIRVFGDCGLRLQELARLEAGDSCARPGRHTSASTASAIASARSRSRRRWSVASTGSSGAVPTTAPRTTSSLRRGDAMTASTP